MEIIIDFFQLKTTKWKNSLAPVCQLPKNQFSPSKIIIVHVETISFCVPRNCPLSVFESELKITQKFVHEKYTHACTIAQ